LFPGGKQEEACIESFSSSGSSESSCFGDSSSSTCGLAAFYAWLGCGGSRVDLQPLVVTAFIFSENGTTAAICASCVSIILLKLNWFLIAEERVSTSAFIIPKFYHWQQAFCLKIRLF